MERKRRRGGKRDEKKKKKKSRRKRREERRGGRRMDLVGRHQRSMREGEANGEMEGDGGNDQGGRG